ncbi:hypothetical protein E3O06_03485 [Cryobacterium glaciale]|uniref:Uncharacterized protein n=1 Tax=Cryobacterium glaciale TaxID=1259145 RepID=A0A4R8V2E7_9MICO|nr:hypothetical protein [Cryobacterium glaciale]TFB76429.1 hypothetical protein E3O06_03485 [Cryobacterium glaciale]
MLIAGLVFHYLRENIDREAPGWRILSGLGSLLYADAEANLWAWSSGLLLASIGLTLSVIGFATRNDAERGAAYFILAAITLLMSADEVAQLHEKLARFDLGTGLTFAWLSVGVPLAVVIGLTVLWISRRIDRRLRRRLIVAGLLYLLGAVGFETLGGLAVGGHVDDTDRASLPYHLLLGLEEGLEATGAIMALAAALSVLTFERTASGILVRTALGRASENAMRQSHSPEKKG